MRHWEDFQVGQVVEVGPITVSEAEIVEFAKQFDPQPFHIDPEAAKQSPFGGLIASGWHTAAMMMRILIDRFIDGEASLGSPGLGPIRWKLPVRPGDVLRVRARVLDSRISQSKPDRGMLTFEVEVINGRDEVVMVVENWLAILRTRPKNGGA